jgi:hypothetical protein
VPGCAIERKYIVGWRTVQQPLALARPPERKGYPQWSSKLDPFKPAIDAMLREDLRTPRRRRHAVTRVCDGPGAPPSPRRNPVGVRRGH